MIASPLIVAVALATVAFASLDERVDENHHLERRQFARCSVDSNGLPIGCDSPGGSSTSASSNSRSSVTLTMTTDYTSSTLSAGTATKTSSSETLQEGVSFIDVLVSDPLAESSTSEYTDFIETSLPEAWATFSTKAGFMADIGFATETASDSMTTSGTRSETRGGSTSAATSGQSGSATTAGVARPTSTAAASRGYSVAGGSLVGGALLVVAGLL